jgi:hypothetical protein
MGPTRAGVDASLHVVMRRLSQVPAHCIKCEPVHVLGTYAVRKVFFRVSRNKEQGNPPFQVLFSGSAPANHILLPAL